MPAMLGIDTLKFARSLAEAGMDRRQAEALVEGLSEADTSDFATKADIGEVRADVAGLRADMADFRAEVKGEVAELRTETRTESAALRSEMSALKAEMFRFLYLQTLGIVGLTTGLTVTLIKLLP